MTESLKTTMNLITFHIQVNHSTFMAENSVIDNNLHDQRNSEKKLLALKRRQPTNLIEDSDEELIQDNSRCLKRVRTNDITGQSLDMIPTITLNDENIAKILTDKKSAFELIVNKSSSNSIKNLDYVFRKSYDDESFIKKDKNFIDYEWLFDRRAFKNLDFKNEEFQSFISSKHFCIKAKKHIQDELSSNKDINQAKTTTMFYTCENKDQLFESNSNVPKISQRSYSKIQESSSISKFLDPSENIEDIFIQNLSNLRNIENLSNHQRNNVKSNLDSKYPSIQNTQKNALKNLEEFSDYIRPIFYLRNQSRNGIWYKKKDSDNWKKMVSDDECTIEDFDEIKIFHNGDYLVEQTFVVN